MKTKRKRSRKMFANLYSSLISSTCRSFTKEDMYTTYI